MAELQSLLKGKNILAVDDEKDILETIQDILDEANVEGARDYESASEKIQNNRYDLAILDIMGVDGLKLLEEAVAKGIPSIMLTAHAINPETLMESIRKGAIAYLPKETLAELDVLLEKLIGAHEKGEPPWKLVFDEIGGYFDERFGKDWRKIEQGFWKEFDRVNQIGKGIQERIKHDKKVIDKGI